MGDHITIGKAGGTWVIRSGGAVLGETRDALEMREGTYAPVIYFPRQDVAMAFLDRTDKVSHCPHKGDASYYTIVNKSSRTENAVWTYENPLESVAAIKDYMAFYVSDTVKVEQV
ncbi:MAG: hypothetical protein ACI8R4_001244 [Paracoccaceae bacterium]|jgi:uncharacterized protein (DUF427 family)